MEIHQLGRTSAGAALLALTALPSVAQDHGWAIGASFYGWFNDTAITADTPHGQVEAELSFSDALDNLDFAFMGSVEAQKDRWSLIGDLMYFKLSAFGASPNGVLFSGVEAESQITIVNTYAAYRVHEEAGLSVDLGGGLRAVWADVDTTLVGAGAPTQSFSQDRDWVDPVVLFRAKMDFNEDWFGTLLLDAGGTSDTQSWQVLTTVGYRLNDRWTFQGGYRYMDMEWDTSLGEASLEFSGPILGATLHF